MSKTSVLHLAHVLENRPDIFLSTLSAYTSKMTPDIKE